MKIVFRVDASLTISTGHVMRCLTLAHALKQQKVEISFICREHKGNLIERIKQEGFIVYSLAQNLDTSTLKAETQISTREALYGLAWLGCTQQEDALETQKIVLQIQPDWLIVDHYALDATWHLLLKDDYKNLMVIDDLADRHYHCDVVLDQTYGREEKDYIHLVPEKCALLLGSQYALLRPEFSEWRDYSLKRRAVPEFKKLLITMGGVDPDNITGQILTELQNCELPKALEVIVVMGQTAPHIQKIEQQIQTLPFKVELKTNVNNMAELMANADLAIGAAGATTWERCCLGLPSIQMILAENQNVIAKHLKKAKATLVLKKLEELPSLINAVYKWMLILSENSELICNGLGTQQSLEQIIYKKQ